MGDRLATIDIGQKVGAAVPLSVRQLGPHGPRPISVPSGILIHPTVYGHNTPTLQTYRTDRQRSRSIGRTVTSNGRPKTILMSICIILMQYLSHGVIFYIQVVIRFAP